MDDALYYPIVARSIASGHGSSFDGITQTNGYHPLWCWLQVPIAAVTGPFGSMTYLWFVKAFIAVVVALNLVVWERLIRRVTGSAWMSATFVLLLGAYWWSVHYLYSGMETPLVVLLIGVSLLLAHRLLENRSTGTAVALGIAMAFTFLARLDSVFFLGVLGCVLLVALRRNFRLLVAGIVPMVLIPVPYLWWNLTYFGSFLPVSGIRKSVFRPNLADQFAILSHFAAQRMSKIVTVLHPAGVVLALVIGVLAIGASWLARREFREHASTLNVLWTVPIGALLHFLYVATFMVEADVPWYQYSEYLTVFLIVSVAVAAAVSWLQSREARWANQWAPFVVVFLAVVTALATFAPKAIPDVTNVRSYDAAVWARERLASDNARFGMYDPGVFRFVSGFDTVALNGLASTPEVTKLVQEANWVEIIRRYNIRYVVQFVAEEDIAGIPPRYVKYRSEPFEKYLWRYDKMKPGRFLILDSSYSAINSLI